MKRFGTQGPVNPKENYVVSRTTEIADLKESLCESPLMREVYVSIQMMKSLMNSLCTV